LRNRFEKAESEIFRDVSTSLDITGGVLGMTKEKPNPEFEFRRCGNIGRARFIETRCFILHKIDKHFVGGERHGITCRPARRRRETKRAGGA